MSDPPITPIPNVVTVPDVVAVPNMPLAESGLVNSLTGRDWVAISFAGVILLFIFVICCVLLKDWYAPIPGLSNMPLANQKDAIEHYKDLTGILSERLEKTFDMLVTKGLLPLFATLLGFILGKKAND
jgi:hypothetical protein